MEQGKYKGGLLQVKSIIHSILLKYLEFVSFYKYRTDLPSAVELGQFHLA